MVYAAGAWLAEVDLPAMRYNTMLYCADGFAIAEDGNSFGLVLVPFLGCGSVFGYVGEFWLPSKHQHDDAMLCSVRATAHHMAIVPPLSLQW